LAVLPDHFRCVAFDQRGYGASSPARGTSVTRMADDTAALCAALGIAHAYVVGLSLGGAVAQALALRHPQLVDGLVVAAPPIFKGSTGRSEVDAVQVCAMVTAAFSDEMRRTQPDLTARVIDECLETDLDILRNFNTADLDGYDQSQIAAATLVIAGELDVLAPPPPLRELAATIPNAEYLEFAGTGHWLNQEAAAGFNHAIMCFIAAHPCAR
jgi:pimeloyl-ACP methyl ester carboxylesterase